jgi:hypothetical protein
MRRSLLFLALSLGLGGCISAPTPGERVDRFLDNDLVQSSHAAVSVPAAIGTGLGLAVGLPVAFLASPVTVPLGLVACRGDPQSKLDIILNSFLWPAATTATGGAYALGGLPSKICDDR